MSSPVVTIPVVTVPKSTGSSWLKRLGHLFKIGVTQALAVEEKLLPAEEAAALVVTAINPVAGGTFEAILASIVKVEQVATAVGASSGTGQQKLEAAIPGVEDAILSNPLFKGKTIANLALWNNAIEKIAGSIADLTNAVEDPTK
jgi:hypothetical protein